MATARNVLDALNQFVLTICSSLVPAPGVLRSAVGWPPMPKLQAIPQSQDVLVSVFDRGVSLNTTRWPIIPASNDIASATGVSVVASANASPLLGGQTLVITCSGTPLVNDTAVLQFGTGSGNVLGGYTAVGGDTLSTFVTAWTAAIATSLAGLATVTRIGSIISVTNTSAAQQYCTVNAANLATRNTEYNRLSRHIAVSFFCPTEIVRQAVTDPFESQLAQSRNGYGFQLANTEWVRLMYERDIYIEDQQLQGVFRRDFFMECEYGITGLAIVYPVLGTTSTLTVTPQPQD
jgi:hypothetical protein